MPENGIIFSDGICDDFIEFNSGKSVELGRAKEKVFASVYHRRTDYRNRHDRTWRRFRFTGHPY